MSYKSKHKRKQALNGTLTHKELHEQFKKTAIETGKDIIIGVVGGGIAGVIIGKPSLLIGAGITGYGHFAEKPMARTFGMGMMMGGGMSVANSAMNGLTADEIKDRVLKFKDGFFSKLYLDKVFKKTTPATQQSKLPAANENATNGFGELDLSELSKFEQQMLQSGADFQKKKEAEKNTTEGMGKSYAEMVDETPIHY